MKTPSGIRKAVPIDPVVRVGGYLGTLRKRHIIGRLLIVFTAALAADLTYDITAVVAFNIWGIKIYLPFFFEILLAILLIRELPGWQIEKIASALDSRFLLKDRLYSFVWYSRNSSVRQEIRRAQAKESLTSIEFSSILDRTRIRFPYYLSILVLLTGVLFYIAWNASYIPQGITTRIISRTFAPDHPPADTNFSPDLAVTGGETSQETDPAAPAIQAGGEVPQRSSRANTSQGDGAEGNEPGDPAGSRNQEQPGKENLPVGSSDPVEAGAHGPAGGGPGKPATNDPPDAIRSNPVSETVSEPVPPMLKNSSSYAFQDLPEATKFLSLIPGQGNSSPEDLDRDTISNFEEGIDQFPDLYKDHLQTYYWELKQWDKSP